MEVIIIFNFLPILTTQASELHSGISQVGRTIYADSSSSFSNINPYLLFKIFELADHLVLVFVVIFFASLALIYSMQKISNAKSKLTRYLMGFSISILGALVIGFFIMYPMITKASGHISNARDPFNTTAAKVIVFEDNTKNMRHSIILSPEVAYIKEPIQ